MTATLEGGEWSAVRPGRTLPLGKNRYLLYRRLSEPQGRSGKAEKSRPHRDLIPDRPARNQSLYRLSYPAHWSYFIGRVLITRCWGEQLDLKWQKVKNSTRTSIIKYCIVRKAVRRGIRLAANTLLWNHKPFINILFGKKIWKKPSELRD